MRNLTALLLLLSLGSLYLVSTAPASHDHRSICCSNLTKVMVPVRNIVTYWKTGSNCPLQAIVFEMLNEKKNTSHLRCVDRTAVWVDSHMRKVDLKNKITERPKL